MKATSVGMLAVLSVLLASVQGKREINVDPTDLVSAVKSAQDGDILKLSGSFYPVHYNNGEGIEIKKSISLTSFSSATFFFPTSNLLSSSNSSFKIFSVRGESVNFTGLVFSQGNPSPSSSSSRSSDRNKPPSTDPTHPPSFPEVNAIVYTHSGSVSEKNQKTLTIRGCKFRKVEVDGKTTSGRMVRVILDGEENDFVTIAVIRTHFIGLNGFSALFFSTTTKDETAMAGAELFVNNSYFKRNSEINSESLIYFDLETTLPSFSVSIYKSIFSDNKQQLVGGPMPNPGVNSDIPTTTFVITNTIVDYNSWVAKEAEKRELLPFYFIDVRRAANVLIDSLGVEMNNVSNAENSETSPYFGIIHIDTHDVKNQGNVKLLTKNCAFNFNYNCAPILITGDNNLDITANVVDSIFKNNVAAVTAGVSFFDASEGSTVDFTNCTFTGNSITDSILVGQWGESSNVIFCEGKAVITISGNRTTFKDNGKLRPISGTCKRSCSLEDKSQNAALCGEIRITLATLTFSCFLGISVLGLVCYHVVYVTFLSKKNEKDMGYEKLLD